MACGGFFCQNVPIDQSGEEILFGVNPDTGRVQATIRIFYQGDAKDFAWVLPMPNVPEISTSSDLVFQRLRAASNPSFQVEWKEGAECANWFISPPQADAGTGGGAEDGGGGVQVLDSGQVGPYDFAVVQSDDAQALINWLNENDFDQPAASTPLIENYVAQKMVFVALKLQQDKGSGDITPVVLDFAEEAPCVPIVLTQIAAQPNMPVTVWVASTARVVPNNWFEVEPNWKKLDWLGGGSNYNQLVTDAVNEAAGRAFVTEYAGSTSLLTNAFLSPGQYDLQKLANVAGPVEFVLEVQAQFSQGSATLLAILREFVPMPQSAIDDGVSESAFYSWPTEYQAYYDQIEFDALAATDAVDERIVTPLQSAQDMVDGYPYLTRLFTTLSPDEMTRDPIFKLNSEIGDVSNVHVAKGTAVCDPNNNTIVDIEIELPGGEKFAPMLPPWGWGGENYTPDDVSGESDAASIWLVPESGERFLVSPENVDYADNQLNLKTAEQVISDLGGPVSGEEGGDGGESADDGGESAGEGSSGEGSTGEGAGEGSTGEGSGEGSAGEGGGSGSGDGGGSDSGDDGDGGCNTGGHGSWFAGLALAALFFRRRRS
jgi:hypothetical protein